VDWTLSLSVAEFSGAFDSTPGVSFGCDAAGLGWDGCEPLDCATAAVPTPRAARTAAPVATTVLRENRSNIVFAPYSGDPFERVDQEPKGRR
jgi:hypothetical protein